MARLLDAKGSSVGVHLLVVERCTAANVQALSMYFYVMMNCAYNPDELGR